MTALDLFKGSRGSHSTTSITHTEGTVYEYQVRYGGRIHHIVKHRFAITDYRNASHKNEMG